MTNSHSESMRARSSSVVVETSSSSKAESKMHGAKHDEDEAMDRRSRRQSMPNFSRSSAALASSSVGSAPFTHIRSFDEVQRKFGAGGGGSYELQQHEVSVPGKPPVHQPRRSNVYRVKIVTLGERCTGKSCILKRFCENVFVGHASAPGGGGLGRRKSLAASMPSSQKGSGAGDGGGAGIVSTYMETIGVDYGVKDVGVPRTDKFIRINMYDLAGGREYYEIRKEFYDDAQGLLLCYDPRRRETFERLEQWLLEVDTNISPAGSGGLGSSAPGVVCATKVRFRLRYHDSVVRSPLLLLSLHGLLLLLPLANADSLLCCVHTLLRLTTNSNINNTPTQKHTHTHTHTHTHLSRYAFLFKQSDVIESGGHDVVSRNEAEEWASRRGFMFFEVSSLSGQNVHAMFWAFLSAVIDIVPGADASLRERTAQHALVQCADAGITAPLRLEIKAKRDSVNTPSWMMSASDTVDHSPSSMLLRPRGTDLRRASYGGQQIQTRTRSREKSAGGGPSSTTRSNNNNNNGIRRPGLLSR